MRGEQLRRTVAGWIVRAYPAAWRGRYQDEVMAVLESTAITWRVVADLMRGAIDARVRAARVRGPRDWLTLFASTWTVLAGTVFWFYPSGTSSIAGALPWGQTALIVEASIAFGCFPFWLRSSRGWLVAWSLVILVAYVPTWGATVWIVPAALMVGVASMLPRRAMSRDS